MRALLAVGCAYVVAGALAQSPEPATKEEQPELPAPAYLTLMLARDSAVHEELGLDAPQVAAVRQAVAQVDGRLWLLRDVPVPKCAPQLAAELATLRKGLAEALQPAQIERFDQLVMQARGAKALSSSDVRERVGLSDEQCAQLDQLMADSQGANLDADRVRELLTPDQQSKVAALFGSPFDLSQVTYVGCGQAPELREVQAWINCEPLSLAKLKGKVVAVHFWAFGCINCVHNLPHYQAWHQKFPPSELTIIGIHTPETSAERDLANLEANVEQRAIQYPVAFDAEAANWKAWGNNMWPSVYLIDRQGRIRYWWYGELNWEGAKGEETMRQRIEQLIAEQ